MQRYKRVTVEVRCQIFALLQTKISMKEVAKVIGHHRSTIYRELSRNGGKNYDPKEADLRAKLRFKRCRRKRIINKDLKRKVTRLILKGLSPEQTAGRLKQELDIKISPQTIYSEIKSHSKELTVHLRRFGKHRGRGRANRRVKKQLGWKKSVHERPAEVATRNTIGHWERDTMYVKDRKTLIVCLERKSRYVTLDLVKQPYSKHLTDQTKKMLQKIKAKVLTMTNDNGNEFMDAKTFGVPVYYCDPHAPHQKGSIENAIGLLRQFLPRTTDASKLKRSDLKAIQDKLNHRPRKCLDYRTPYEVMYGKTVALAV